MPAAIESNRLYILLESLRSTAPTTSPNPVPITPEIKVTTIIDKYAINKLYAHMSQKASNYTRVLQFDIFYTYVEAVIFIAAHGKDIPVVKNSMYGVFRRTYFIRNKCAAPQVFVYALLLRPQL